MPGFLKGFIVGAAVTALGVVLLVPPPRPPLSPLIAAEIRGTSAEPD